MRSLIYPESSRFGARGWLPYLGELDPYSDAALMSDVSRILSAIELGDPKASAELLPLVYQELRRLASVRMARESPDHTLQATALVHEAYLRLVGSSQPQHWNGRGHFFAAAAEAMRRILIESARHKSSLKAGGGLQRVNLGEEIGLAAGKAGSLIDLDDALSRLELMEPRKAQLVKLRFFAGLDLAAAADLLGISVATAKRDWLYARAWLYGEIAGD
jgi:RNA polymerase sigma factor (TIGR02999 family)